MTGEILTILLVEDNADHAELILRTLEEHRVAMQIRHLTDGQSALDYLHHQGEFSDPLTSPRPHLILLDLRLPRVDGIDVLKALKADDNLRMIPVVILTTSEAEKDVLQAYDNYANSYLVKPVSFEHFKTLLDDLGFYWLNWNTNPPL